MRDLLLISLGGALGTAARYGLQVWAARSLGGAFPWGTLLVNVSGSFIIGLVFALTGPEGRWMIGPGWRHFILIGLCGGYTTFSTFSLQTLQLTQGREYLPAGGYIAASVGVCLLAVWLGHLGGDWINRLLAR